MGPADTGEMLLQLRAKPAAQLLKQLGPEFAAGAGRWHRLADR
jgi:hypothetical protein